MLINIKPPAVTEESEDRPHEIRSLDSGSKAHYKRDSRNHGL